MKDYYQILRVSRHANETEIKRAFRRLAVVFHPDKNPSEEALTLFQEINEAYEVLSDPEKRPQYDILLRGGFQQESTTFEPRWHPDPAYRRRYQPGYRRPAPRPSESLLMMAHFLKYFHTVCYVGLGWCCFLIFDYSLPPRISVENVLSESNRIYSWRFDHVPDVVVTDQGNQFPVSNEGVDFFPVGSKVKVNTSRILNLLIKVESGDKKFTIYQLDSVYQNFMFVPIILLVFSIFGLTLKSGIEFRFSFGVALIMVMIFNLIFIFFSIL